LASKGGGYQYSKGVDNQGTSNIKKTKHCTSVFL